MQQKQKIWTPIVHFAAHTFVGSIIFLIVGLPAVGLSSWCTCWWIRVSTPLQCSS